MSLTQKNGYTGWAVIGMVLIVSAIATLIEGISSDYETTIKGLEAQKASQVKVIDKSEEREVDYLRKEVDRLRKERQAIMDSYERMLERERKEKSKLSQKIESIKTQVNEIPGNERTTITKSQYQKTGDYVNLDTVKNILGNK